ncbi:hypothetical protein BY996DRAFT_201453 [Phakopsora pachyrhizi]|nr:hypothetical protein BY996DRAFT_201453 [Phakopsora pachyrhizi]
MNSGSAPLSTPLLPINNPSSCNFRSSYSNPQYYSQNSSPPANNSQNPTQDGQSFQTLHGEHQRIEKKRSRETIEDEELYPNMKFSRSSESSNLFLEMSNIKGSLSSAAQTVDQDLSSLNIPTSDNFGYPLSELCPTNKCKVPPMHSSDGTLYPATACSADTLASAYPDFTSSLVTSDLALPLKSQDRPTQFKLSIPASPTEPELSEVIHKNSINSGDLLGRLTPKHKTSSKVALSFKNSREQPVLSLESTINNHRSHNIPSPVKQQKDRPESREELKTKGALFSKHEYLHQSSYSDQNELIHSLSQAAIEAELSRSGSKQVKNIKESSDHSSITTDVVGMADANSSCLAQNQAELQGVGSGFIGNSFGFNCNPTEQNSARIGSIYAER